MKEFVLWDDKKNCFLIDPLQKYSSTNMKLCIDHHFFSRPKVDNLSDFLFFICLESKYDGQKMLLTWVAITQTIVEAHFYERELLCLAVYSKWDPAREWRSQK